ncbi:hypothetical protein SLEP1_g35350 [Rubroshorea leprosula]|uniref:Uncharacterized protein n=1 Tax=Rubroshorea leprosula TaxID=152421 RepID=A0AAV5KN62_9ROSI|nr:hypothetical protein SLEP1_g35350 [Rubroshorea leprosula]
MDKTNEGLDQVVSGLFQLKQGLEFESLWMQQPPLGDSPTISRCATRVGSGLVGVKPRIPDGKPKKTING